VVVNPFMSDTGNTNLDCQFETHSTTGFLVGCSIAGGVSMDERNHTKPFLSAKRDVKDESLLAKRISTAFELDRNKPSA